MEINKLNAVSHTGGEAAVGADSSRPSPIYRPVGSHPDYFVKPLIGPSAPIDYLLNSIIDPTGLPN
jgi:hypothetical protein